MNEKEEEFEYDHTKPNVERNAAINWIGTIYQRTSGELQQKISAAMENKLFKYAVFQMETCGSTGRTHAQIFVQTSERKRYQYLQGLLGDGKDHWEIARNVPKARNYCKKQLSRLEGPWEYGTWAGGDGGKGKRNHEEAFGDIATLSRREHMAKYPDLWSTRAGGLDRLFNNKLSTPGKLENFEPNQWQRFLRGLLDKPADNRTIYWVYDLRGSNGKTTFGRWIASETSCYFTGVARADRNYHSYDGETTVIYDVPRHGDEQPGELGGKGVGFPYPQLEKFKDGHLPAGMFGTAPKHFPSPHVVVLANFEPDFSRLTIDRWVLLDLSVGDYRANGPITSEPIHGGTDPKLTGKRIFFGLESPDLGNSSERNRSRRAGLVLSDDRE